MRGSAAFLAVLAVTSCSVGVNGAHFVKSGITGHGTGRGNGRRSFGNGENDGHRIGKRSNLGHDIARQAAFGSATAGMRDPDTPFVSLPVLPRPIRGFPPPGPTGRPVSTKSWKYPPRDKSHGLPLRRAKPSVSESKVLPLSTLKFIPPPEVKEEAKKIISKAFQLAHALPAILPVRRSFARSQDFYRSDLKNRRSRYSGLRSYSPLRSYPTLYGPFTDIVPVASYKRVRNMAPVQPETEENFRGEVRSAIIKYLIQFWNKISKLFKPGSNSGGGTGGVPPKGQISGGGGKEVGPGLAEEHEVHTERPPKEYDGDVITKPETPVVVDDSAQVIHLSSGEDHTETAEDVTGEGGSEIDEDYEPQFWELRDSTRKGDDFIDVEDDTYIPSWYGPMAKSIPHSNREARRATRKEDVASKITDALAGTRRKNMRDDLDTLTDIFGRLAVD